MATRTETPLSTHLLVVVVGIVLVYAGYSWRERSCLDQCKAQYGRDYTVKVDEHSCSCVAPNGDLKGLR